MNVKIESILFLLDEAIQSLYLNLVNTLVLTRDEEELRRTIAIMSEKTEMEDFFAYGYDIGHFWLRQRVTRHSQHCHNERLLIVEF